MSLAEFVQSRAGVSRPMQGRAVQLTFPGPRRAVGLPALTTGRPAGVGRPVGAPPVAASRPDPVLAEVASTGLEALAVLERRLRDVVQELRWRRIDSGRRGLMDVVHGVQALVSLAAVTAQSRHREDEDVPDLDGHAASALTRRAVHDVIAAQQGDGSGLADALEQSLLPALTLWRAVFEAIGSPSREPDPHGWAA